MENTPVTTETPEPVKTAEPSHIHDNYAPLRSYFDINDPSDQTVGKFKTIYEYLRGDKDEYNEFDLMRDMRDLQFKLGSTNLGETRVDQVYRYAKLASQAKQIETEIKGMMR